MPGMQEAVCRFSASTSCGACDGGAGGKADWRHRGRSRPFCYGSRGRARSHTEHPSCIAVFTSCARSCRFPDCDTYAGSDLDPQFKGRGVPYDKINSALAIPACKNAVRQHPNSIRLIYQLGRAYAKHNDFSLALVQYRKAADQGYAPAQNDLGVMYAYGEGIAKDEVQAVAWYRKAAEQGLGLAQSNLGEIYYDGKGVPQDYAEALKWWRKAADKGNADAQSNLGPCTPKVWVCRRTTSKR